MACVRCKDNKAALEHGSSGSIWEQVQLAISSYFGLRGRDSIPAYWKNVNKDLNKGLDRTGEDFFDDVYPVAQSELEVLQRLIDAKLGNSESETSFRVIRAVRIENSALWGRYQKKAASIAAWHGKCDFARRGPPITGQLLRDGPFGQLDAEICEAYLWHGTHPHTAFKISRVGFDVNHRSVTGKRFGPGGYFTEDPVRADHYAGAGRGLYKDYYAVLLCRVILGRQLHTAEFRAENLTDRSHRHDSTLAEPRDASWREFIVYEGDQVYPEYALIYEHCSLKSGTLGRRPLDKSSPFFMSSLPEYWRSAMGGCDYFHGAHPAKPVQPFIQDMIDQTWLSVFTHDRKGKDGKRILPRDVKEDMPLGLRLVKVLRIEDSDMWIDYMNFQKDLRTKGVIYASGSALHVKSTEALPDHMRSRLDDSIGEVYLLHGSSPQTVMNIAEEGFPRDLARFNHGKLGDGAYFVEDACHADEYAMDDADGYFMGYHAMLLCRVTLGRLHVLSGPGARAEAASSDSAFDSSSGEVTASVGTFREFLLSTRAQIYPEYAMIYERRYTTQRVR
eukprot:TRINITY_DN107190_c0_g1_i1.p1 TRINITY_DN107190_c0_g1~~TRINITY_DN107190_c0_g1_i1.p1  ORF type:complete len:560 (-),score=109.71 TRINITY_DN107190_c0_g1_i1:36-1715(-)